MFDHVQGKRSLRFDLFSYQVWILFSFWQNLDTPKKNSDNSI